jgi:membrane protease YdiL (CAAX protease family)
MIKKVYAALALAALLVLSGPRAAAQEEEQGATAPAPKRINPGLFIANEFAPGILQLSEGKSEGWWYLPGTAFALGGSVIQALGLLDPGAMGGWAFPAGTLIGEIGMSQYTYSYYAFLRDLSDARVDPAKALRRGRESYGELLLAPFDPKNVFSPDILPVMAYAILPSISADNARAIAEYWNRDSVSFMGIGMSPGAGLAAETAYAMALNLFVASFEETLFRGIALERLGLAASSLTFGAMHLGNLLIMDPTSFDDVWSVSIQTLSATAIGFYLGYVTKREGYDLRKAVTLHYWNNVIAFVLPFMINGGGELGMLSQDEPDSSPSKGLVLPGMTLGVTLPLY